MDTSVRVKTDIDLKRVKRNVLMMKWKKYAAGYGMLAPFLLMFILFVVAPVVWSLSVGFTHYNIVQPMRWAGLSNYIELFTNDDLFLIALKNTFNFAIIAGPIGFLASFFFAWVINQLKFRNIFSLFFFAPSISAPTAMAVVWLFLFSPDRLGLANNFLLRLGFIQDPLAWTMDPKLIMPLIILISLWMSLGTGFLVNLAGINSVDEAIYEAASIDGVKNKFQELFYITLPSVKPQLLFNSIMSTVAALGVYDIAVGIAGFPSPDYAAHTIVAHMIDHGFLRFELGYASAIAFILFMLNFTIGRIFMKILSSKDD